METSKDVKKILILNASLGGSSGNTAKLLKIAEKILSKNFEVETVHLRNGSTYSEIRDKINKSSGVFIGTGTHWESWSSFFQKFIEDATPDEGTKVWLGKPCAVLVTMHSLGGDGVASRIMNVMNLFGAYVPPMCTMVYSFTSQTTIEKNPSGITDDLWHKEDLNIVCHNLSEAVRGNSGWKTWVMDKKNTDRVWVA